MGLDMYLSKKTYVKRWNHYKPSNKFSVLVKKGGKKYNKIDPKNISYVIEEIGYWRKANAIHKWFVDNVQKGEDDCREYYVSSEQLQELLDRVNKVLDASKMKKGKIQNGQKMGKKGWEPILEDGEYILNSEVAEELLPTQEGFFFGNTDYDQWYIDNLKNTKEILEKALEDTDGSFYYQSSW